MAITTRLQPKYAFKMLAIIIVSIGLGIWGIYDFAISIPGKERSYHRYQICEQVRDAIESSSEITQTSALVDEELDAYGGPVASVDPAQAKDAIQNIRSRDPESWRTVLTLFDRGLEEKKNQPVGSTASGEIASAAWDVARKGIDQTADISQPGEFDHIVRGLLFVPCLPIGLYMILPYIKARRKVYRLDDDGTVHGPGVSWSKDEIADIDMSRWMRKSIAEVVHENGERLKLDDYVYKNVHLIVGAIASERCPDLWDEEAKDLTAKKSQDADESEADSGDAEEAADDETVVAAAEGSERDRPGS